MARGVFRSRPDFAQSAINLETNAGTHDHGRALDEATDLLIDRTQCPPTPCTFPAAHC